MLVWILVGILIGALLFGYWRRAAPSPYYADWWPALLIIVLIIVALYYTGAIR